jgi:hypothetical protein
MSNLGNLDNRAFVLLPISEYEELRRRAEAAVPLYEVKEGTDELKTGVPCGYWPADWSKGAGGISGEGQIRGLNPQCRRASPLGRSRLKGRGRRREWGTHSPSLP